CNNNDQPGERRLRLTLRRAHRATLLEAFATENRASLRRTERHRSFLAALRESGLGLGTHRSSAIRAAADSFRTLGLARFAALGLVLEALVGEKHLFAGSEHKFRIAFRTLQYFVVEFHEPPPLSPERARGMSEPCTVGPGR